MHSCSSVGIQSACSSGIYKRGLQWKSALAGTEELRKHWLVLFFVKWRWVLYAAKCGILKNISGKNRKTKTKSFCFSCVRGNKNSLNLFQDSFLFCFWFHFFPPRPKECKNLPQPPLPLSKSNLIKVSQSIVCLFLAAEVGRRSPEREHWWWRGWALEISLSGRRRVGEFPLSLSI